MMIIVVGVVLGLIALLIFLVNRKHPPLERTEPPYLNLLGSTIEDNARIIAAEEGKPIEESRYLALCMMVDHAAIGNYPKILPAHIFDLVQARYDIHFNDLMTYAAWTSGKITLKPEFHDALVARHAKAT